MQDALERLAEPGRARARVGDLVMLAAMLQRRLARERLADDRYVFPGARQRLAVRLAVPAFHHLRARWSDAAEKTPARERLQAHRGHRRACRRARRHLHDAGAALDLRRS